MATCLLATIAVTAVAPVVPLGTTASVAASSTPRSTSPAVADAATVALGALDDWKRTGDPLRYVEYLEARDLAAELSAFELGLDPAEMRVAWRETTVTKQVALLAALTQLGVPYRRNASIEGTGFDCSGLTAFAYGRAGIELPRQSTAQIRAATRVDHVRAAAGDLVQYPGHVMLYLGVDHAIVHSRTPGTFVELSFVGRRANSARFGDPTA